MRCRVAFKVQSQGCSMLDAEGEGAVTLYALEEHVVRCAHGL